MEKINKLIICLVCGDNFKDTPVTLTCCNTTICESHVESQLKNCKSKIFKCEFCQKTHRMKNHKFPINETIQNLLKEDITELEETYYGAYDEINKLQKSKEIMSNLKNDPNYFIYEYVADLKRQIDLRKEKIKEKIDDVCEKMIQKLDNYREECYENVKQAKLIEKNDELIKG